MTNDGPKSLKDFLGDNGDNKPKSLEEVMRMDEADRQADADAAAKEGANGRRFRRGTAVGAIALIAVCGALFNPWVGIIDYGNEPRVELKKAKLSENSSIEDPNSQGPWYENEGPVETPIKLDADFLNEPRAGAPKVGSEFEDAGRALYANQRTYYVVDTGLKSEDRGATSDFDKAVNEDGSLNPNYNYVTSDVFYTETGEIVNRLINPIYGSWAEFQSADSNASKNFKLYNLEEVFTEKYLKKWNKASDKSSLPVYADWKSNDYGMTGTIIPRIPRWFGEVTDSDVKFVYDKANVNYEYTVTYKLKYTAWDVNKKKLIKNGTMKLKFVTDRSAVLEEEKFRLKIDEAELKIK